MSKAPGGKSRRKKKRDDGSFQINPYYVGLPLLGVGLVFLILVFVVPKGPGMALVALLAAGALGTGGYLCWQTFFKKRLEFGDDAVLMYRCRDNKLIGRIPYANIASAEIDDHKTVSKAAKMNTLHSDDWILTHGGEVRERVVAITVFKTKDLDTFWPFESEERNDFDFYINAKLSLSLSQIREEINGRVFETRQKKVRATPARDEHLE